MEFSLIIKALEAVAGQEAKKAERGTAKRQ